MPCSSGERMWNETTTNNRVHSESSHNNLCTLCCLWWALVTGYAVFPFHTLYLLSFRDNRENEQRGCADAHSAVEAAGASSDCSAGWCVGVRGKPLSQNFTIATVAVQQRSSIHRVRCTYCRTWRWFVETLPHLGERHFRLCFRVSRSTFCYLVDLCCTAMESEVTNMKLPPTIKKRVGIALYKLCFTVEDRTIAHLFAVGHSTIKKTYHVE